MAIKPKGTASVDPGRIQQVVMYGAAAILIHPINTKCRDQSRNDQCPKCGEPSDLIHNDQLGDHIQLWRDHHSEHAQTKQQFSSRKFKFCKIKSRHRTEEYTTHCFDQGYNDGIFHGQTKLNTGKQIFYVLCKLASKYQHRWIFHKCTGCVGCHYHQPVKWKQR